MSAPPLPSSSKAIQRISARDMPSTSGTSRHRGSTDIVPMVETDDSSASTTDSEEDPHLGDHFSKEFVSKVAMIITKHLEFETPSREEVIFQVVFFQSCASYGRRSFYARRLYVLRALRGISFEEIVEARYLT